MCQSKPFHISFVSESHAYYLFRLCIRKICLYSTSTGLCYIILLYYFVQYKVIVLTALVHKDISSAIFICLHDMPNTDALLTSKIIKPNLF